MHVKITNIYNEVVNFIFPPACIACNNLLNENEKTVCANCLSSLEGVPEHELKLSSAPKIDINKIVSLYRFIEGETLQKLVHALKYEKFKSVGVLFGKLLGDKIKQNKSIQYQYVIPVPLHISKKRDRGYNQSYYIAKGVAESLGADVLEKCLIRTRFTQTQTKLDIHERRENVKQAFRLNKKYTDKITGKNIVLVDDVITTGATIVECMKVLKSAGCGDVLLCSVGRAV